MRVTVPYPPTLRRTRAEQTRWPLRNRLSRIARARNQLQTRLSVLSVAKSAKFRRRTTEGKSPRRCYACSGFDHLSRNCPSRSRQQPAQPAEYKTKWSSAVSSAVTGAPQLFSEAVIDGVLIRDALVDTGSAFSMVSSALHDRLPSRPSINSFKNSALDIVVVGGASAEVRGYIDVALQPAGIEVAHLLLVVSNLSFSLLIGIDVLQPQASKMSFGSDAPLELSARLCDVCFEQRTNPSPSYRSSPTVACVAESTTVAPNSASLVTVRLPRTVQNVSTVVIEAVDSTVVILGCAALPSVCAPIADVCRVAVLNNSEKPIEIFVGLLVASVNPVRPVSKSSQAAATAPRLPYKSKLQNVLHGLKIDLLFDTAPHKQQLLSLLGKYLDIFAECDSDVGTTNLTFHEIDTVDVRPLRQPVRRLPFGEMRTAVVFEVDKRVSADIARPSTSPWASPVVMVRKKDGGWQMCMDDRRLNSVKNIDCFPLPRLEEALDAFAGTTVFSNLHLAMAYHQVPVKPSDVEKTAFITHGFLRDAEDAFRPV